MSYLGNTHGYRSTRELSGEEILKMRSLFRKGATQREVAEIFGITRGRVDYACKKLSIPVTNCKRNIGKGEYAPTWRAK